MNVVDVGVEATTVGVVNAGKFVTSLIPLIVIYLLVVSQCGISVVIVAVVVPVFTALTILAIGRVADFGVIALYRAYKSFCQPGFTQEK